MIPPAPTNKVISQIDTIGEFENFVTVRFSHAADLGLPRSFFRTNEEAKIFLSEKHNKNWATIIHDYINLEWSFEINIETDSWKIECLPGIWESNNTEPLDEITCTNKNCSAVVYKNFRTRTSISPSGTYKSEAAPLSRERIISIASKASVIIDKLRIDFSDTLPLNIHFVENNLREWIFLNIRKGFASKNSQATPPPKHLFEAKSLNDFELWDGSAPLLLHFPIKRGDEIKIGNALKKIKNPISRDIYIKFGLLSHPAIIIREYGFNTLPSRKLANKHTDKYLYDEFKFKLHDKFYQ